MSSETTEAQGFWRNGTVIAVLVTLTLVVTVALPGTGALGAFLIAIAAAVAARRQGSFRDLGFRAPASWPRLLGTTLGYAFLLQVAFLVVVEPLLGRITGAPPDLSVFDGVRGNFGNFLILLAIGWVVGGFLEELTFRGFVVGRLRWLFGAGQAATWGAVLIAAVVFGIAHSYQGASGMITTGVTGFVMGAVYVAHRFNLWYAIFMHGFINTFGIVALYLELDRSAGRLLFE